jgi:predicted phosphodiesterase
MKILHVSDLHCKTSSEQQGLLGRARQAFEHLHPDIILITGDLTNKGCGKQYKAVEQFLETLDFCDDVLILPGNRDAKEDGWQDTYKEHISQALNFFHRDPDKGIAIVGLSSMPEITSDQREKMKQFFREGTPGEVRIFCTHRSFLPVPTKKVKPDHLEPQAGDILQELIDLDVDLLCCGHIHHCHAWSISGLVCCSAGLLFAESRQKDGFLEIEIERDLRVVKRSLSLAPPEELYHQPNFWHARERRQKGMWRGIPLWVATFVRYIRKISLISAILGIFRLMSNFGD